MADRVAASLGPGGAAALVTVAHATRALGGSPALAAAVLDARVGVRDASVALGKMDKLGPRLTDGAVGALWAGFVQVAIDHGPTQIRGLREELIAKHGHDAPTTTKAALWVTLDLADLQSRCGSGSTLGGQLLAPETIRRIACDATINPVVLGTQAAALMSCSLDVGRAARLFTPGFYARCGYVTAAAPYRGVPRRCSGLTPTTSSIGLTVV